MHDRIFKHAAFVLICTARTYVFELNTFLLILIDLTYRNNIVNRNAIIRTRITTYTYICILNSHCCTSDISVLCSLMFNSLLNVN